MSVYAINGGAINSQAWNGPGIDANPTLNQVVLFNTTSIDLNWAAVVGAYTYDIQVSLFPDFLTNFHTATVASSDHTFTDSATDNRKRYWRVRPKNSLGNYMEPWGEVASYWLDTSAAKEINLSRNTWGLATIDDTTDLYVMDLTPVYMVMPMNLFRFKARNRLGELISETLTVKDNITLSFERDQMVLHTQMDEFQRFNNINLTFYLVAFKDGLCERPFPHIWKAQFMNDPVLTMIGAGRPDLLQGTLNFEEV